MYAQQEARFFADAVLVVCHAGAVGGADLAENCAALRHDFRNAEAITNFDELAAGDDDLAALGQRRENKEHCGGTVVDDDRGFGASEPLQRLCCMHVAFAARTGLEVVFEIAVLRCSAPESFDHRSRVRRARKSSSTARVTSTSKLRSTGLARAARRG